MLRSLSGFIFYNDIFLNLEYNYKNLIAWDLKWDDDEKYIEIDEPIELKQTIKFKGTQEEYNEWVQPLVDIFNANYDPQKDFKELKQNMLLILNEKTSKFEDNLNKDMYFISSLGFKSDGDRRTNMNIQSLIDTFQISQAQSLPLLYWDYDNVEHEVSLQDLQTLKMEQIINGNNLYTQKKKFKDLIENAKSIEELNKIDLTFIMMDFTKN